MHRKKERLEAKVKELLKEHVQEDNQDDPSSGPRGGENRDKQVQRFQKQAERIERWLRDNDPKYGTTGKEISSNLTDNESAKMKTAHRVIQGYNSQALIDGKHQVIVHTQAFGRGQDHAHGGRPCWMELWRISRVSKFPFPIETALNTSSRKSKPPGPRGD